MALVPFSAGLWLVWKAIDYPKNLILTICWRRVCRIEGKCKSLRNLEVRILDHQFAKIRSTPKLFPVGKRLRAILVFPFWNRIISEDSLFWPIFYSRFLVSWLFSSFVTFWFFFSIPHNTFQMKLHYAIYLMSCARNFSFYFLIVCRN